MKLRDIDFTINPTNKEHDALGIPPLENAVSHPSIHPILINAVWLTVFLLVAAIIYLLMRFLSHSGDLGSLTDIVIHTLQSDSFWNAVAIGVLAQTIDGALGMAYGITSTTFLLASGFSPAVATASVHIAEVFTTGVSGIAHVKMRNVNYKLFLRLLLPGISGALAGAYLVAHIDGALIKPYISLYLFLMGVYLVSKIFLTIRTTQKQPKHVAKLALFGGFADAVGGGGWGPIVTTTLIGSGHDPRTTIGSVNFAEFFLTFGSAIAFSLLVEESPWTIVAGLVAGGVFTAPIAAFITRKLNTKALLMLVGVLISVVSGISLYKIFFA